LRPTNSTLTGFTNFPVIDVAGAGSIGRSIQFGPTNTVFEKRKGAGLYFSSYTNGTESLLLTVDSTTTLGGVAVDTLHNLAIGVDFIGNATTPDAVSLFDITDPGSPMLVHQYSFPSNQVANANVICQTIVASNYVYSMDANNGLIKFVINPLKRDNYHQILDAMLGQGDFLLNLSVDVSSAVLEEAFRGSDRLSRVDPFPGERRPARAARRLTD
jgi:hypothetical protein